MATPATGIDVLAATETGGRRTWWPRDWPCCGWPDLGDAAGEGALVVVAASRSAAAHLAAAAVTGRLSVVVHGR